MILDKIFVVCLIGIVSTFLPSGWDKLRSTDLLPFESGSKVVPIPSRISNFPDDSGIHNRTIPAISKSSLSFEPLSRPDSSDSIHSLRLTLLAIAATIIVAQYRRILWPRSQPDHSFSEPLPPGGLGCPYFGRNMMGGDKKSGRGATFRKIWVSLGNPKVFKSYFMGSPVAVVTGSKNIRPVLNSEFHSPGVDATFITLAPSLMGTESLRNVSGKKEHSFLRRLVGQAMTPTAISKAVPVLQQTATYHVTKLLESVTTRMTDVCHSFTLDVACKQFLGLKLNETELATFHEAVNDWIKGLFSPTTILLPGIRFTRSYKARMYLEKLIEAKIEDLEQNGPDGSTLSAMICAIDERTGKQLTRRQVLDNVLLLILSGSETSAGTLATAMLLLGLHPGVFAKIKEEQKALIRKYGENLTKAQLDNECPYLTAVIKETMRIKTVTGGPPRVTKDTIVVDGKQIPKGWTISCNIRLTHMNDPVTFMKDGSHMDIMKGFKPGRWLDEETLPTTEYMPFGYGYRFCLGVNLAMAEMKIFLAMIARNIDFNLVGNKDLIEWNPSAVIPVPADGTVIAPRVSKIVSSDAPAMSAC